MVEWLDAIVSRRAARRPVCALRHRPLLTYGVMRLVNIAHGDFLVLAAFLILVAAQSLGLSTLEELPSPFPSCSESASSCRSAC